VIVRGPSLLTHAHGFQGPHPNRSAHTGSGISASLRASGVTPTRWAKRETRKAKAIGTGSCTLADCASATTLPAQRSAESLDRANPYICANIPCTNALTTSGATTGRRTIAALRPRSNGPNNLD